MVRFVGSLGEVSRFFLAVTWTLGSNPPLFVVPFTRARIVSREWIVTRLLVPYHPTPQRNLNPSSYSTMATAPHSRSPASLFDLYNVDPIQGLSNDQVLENRALYGENRKLPSSPLLKLSSHEPASVVKESS